ncbi:MAG: hypothetical protein AB7O48_06925 [Cyclobacteriaceae bacterium]
MKKLFTEKQISVSAVLGGPLPPGILIYQNLRRLNKEKEAYITIAATLVFTIGLIYVLSIIPESADDRVPLQIGPSLIGLAFWGVYHLLLSEPIKKEFEAGASSESNWKVAGTTALGIVLYLGIALGIGFSQPPFPGEKMSFQNNEIYYDENTNTEDVKKLADQLFLIGYFSEEYANTARLETWETRYVVTLPISKDFWTDPAVISDLTSLKSLLEVELGKAVTLTLEDYQLDGKTITKSL